MKTAAAKLAEKIQPLFNIPTALFTGIAFAGFGLSLWMANDAIENYSSAATYSGNGINGAIGVSLFAHANADALQARGYVEPFAVTNFTPEFVMKDCNDDVWWFSGLAECASSVSVYGYDDNLIKTFPHYNGLNPDEDPGKGAVWAKYMREVHSSYTAEAEFEAELSLLQSYNQSLTAGADVHIGVLNGLIEGASVNASGTMGEEVEESQTVKYRINATWTVPERTEYPEPEKDGVDADASVNYWTRRRLAQGYDWHTESQASAEVTDYGNFADRGHSPKSDSYP